MLYIQYCCYSVVFHEKQLLKLDALADSEKFHYFSRFHCQMATLYCTILYHTVLPLQYGTVQYSTVQYSHSFILLLYPHHS